ncbi:hypothetical protein B0H13DRAFT_1852075 [Mycena leptocephala]|nr:hypothetical protein B0H13DRAFT_1852075 [Mycena leptocephala]
MLIRYLLQLLQFYEGNLRWKESIEIVTAIWTGGDASQSLGYRGCEDQQADATRFKKQFITASTQHIEDAATCDELARVFGDVLQWTEGNKTISVEFWKVLRAIQERLANHLTIFPSPPVGFSGLEATLGAVCDPAHGHRFAPQGAREDQDNIKKPHASYVAALTSVVATLPSRSAPPPSSDKRTLSHSESSFKLDVFSMFKVYSAALY